MNATAPALSVAALTIDCADPAAVADFWAKVLGRPVSPGATFENATLDATDPASGRRGRHPMSLVVKYQVVDLC